MITAVLDDRSLELPAETPYRQAAKEAFRHFGTSDGTVKIYAGGQHVKSFRGGGSWFNEHTSSEKLQLYKEIMEQKWVLVWSAVVSGQEVQFNRLRLYWSWRTNELRLLKVAWESSMDRFYLNTRKDTPHPEQLIRGWVTLNQVPINTPGRPFGLEVSKRGKLGNKKKKYDVKEVEPLDNDVVVRLHKEIHKIKNETQAQERINTERQLKTKKEVNIGELLNKAKTKMYPDTIDRWTTDNGTWRVSVAPTTKESQVTRHLLPEQAFENGNTTVFPLSELTPSLKNNVAGVFTRPKIGDNKGWFKPHGAPSGMVIGYNYNKKEATAFVFNTTWDMMLSQEDIVNTTEQHGRFYHANLDHVKNHLDCMHNYHHVMKHKRAEELSETSRTLTPELNPSISEDMTWSVYSIDGDPSLAGFPPRKEFWWVCQEKELAVRMDAGALAEIAVQLSTSKATQ